METVEEGERSVGYRSKACKRKSAQLPTAIEREIYHGELPLKHPEREREREIEVIRSVILKLYVGPL